MINNLVGIQTSWVPTTNNVIAHCISQFPSHDDAFRHFLSHAEISAAVDLHALPPKFGASLIHLEWTVANKVAQSKGSKQQKLTFPDRNTFLPPVSSTIWEIPACKSHLHSHKTSSLLDPPSLSSKETPSLAPTSDQIQSINASQPLVDSSSKGGSSCLTHPRLISLQSSFPFYKTMNPSHISTTWYPERWLSGCWYMSMPSLRTIFTEPFLTGSSSDCMLVSEHLSGASHITLTTH